MYASFAFFSNLEKKNLESRGDFSAAVTRNNGGGRLRGDFSAAVSNGGGVCAG